MSVVDVLLSVQLLFAALVTGALYALVALGLNLIYGTMRLLNIAHGELVMIGAYVAYWAFAAFNLGPAISLPAATIVAAAFGVALYYGLFRTVLGSPRLLARIEGNSLLLFFGISVVLQNLAALLFTSSPRAYQALEGVVEIGDATLTESRLAVLLTALVASLAAFLFLRFSMMGQAIKALIQSREAAAIVGIDIDRVQLIGFACGFGLAGLVGALVSLYEPVEPFMGFRFTIAAFVVVILGGIGNLGGTVIAGLLLGALETYGVALTSTSFRSILVYGVFIAIMVMRPEGLFGSRRMAR